MLTKDREWKFTDILRVKIYRIVLSILSNPSKGVTVLIYIVIHSLFYIHCNDLKLKGYYSISYAWTEKKSICHWIHFLEHFEYTFS